MTLIQPGRCRHCKCSDDNACRLADNETCYWISRDRTVCSNPACIVAEKARVERAKAEAKATRPKRLTSADINAMIRGRGRRKKRAA